MGLPAQRSKSLGGQLHALERSVNISIIEPIRLFTIAVKSVLRLLSSPPVTVGVKPYI